MGLFKNAFGAGMTTPSMSVQAGAVTITGAIPGLVGDTIVLDDSVFTTLDPGGVAASAFKDIAGGGGLVDANDRILYNSNNGSLYYDADGSGTIEAVAFAKVIGLPGMTADDFQIV